MAFTRFCKILVNLNLMYKCVAKPSKLFALFCQNIIDL